MTVATEHVNQVTVEWKVSSGEVNTATVTSVGENTWSFALPASLQPVQIEWLAHLEGEGPDQTTPWFQLQSEEPSWSVDENAAYVQSVAMLLVFMVAFLSLQRRSSAPSKNFDPFDSTEDEEVA